MPQESLSALLDGECSDAEIDRLLASLETSPELAQRWSRWQLRREIEEGTRYQRGQSCICAAVMAAIEDPANLPVRSGPVIDLAAWRRRVVALPWKPAVGFAAAASMGAAAVLFMAPQHGVADASGVSSSAGGAMVRVGNPLYLQSGRSGGHLRSVSLTGDNPGPTFADEEYAELLRDYIASRSAYVEPGINGGFRNARLEVRSGESRPVTESDGQR